MQATGSARPWVAGASGLAVSIHCHSDGPEPWAAGTGLRLGFMEPRIGTEVHKGNRGTVVTNDALQRRGRPSIGNCRTEGLLGGRIAGGLGRK